MEKTQEIKKFIADMANNNYSKASDSLKKVVETKLKERIKQALAFKN